MANLYSNALDNPMIELEIEYPADMLRRADGRGYMFRLAPQRSAKEADRTNSVSSGALEEQVVLSPPTNYSKSMQAIQTEYHHDFFKWEELTGVTVATNRSMVELRFRVPDPVRNDKVITGWQYIFFPRKKRAAVIALIKTYLTPEAEHVTGKVNVLS